MWRDFSDCVFPILNLNHINVRNEDGVVFLHAAGEDLTAVRQPRHAQTGGKLRLMLPHILAERLGMQPELPGHLRSGASGLFQAGYGAGILRGGGFQVLLRAGEVDGLPLAALVPAVLHDQPAVPYPQVVAQAGVEYLLQRSGSRRCTDL